MNKRSIENLDEIQADEKIDDPNYPEKTPGQTVTRPGTPISEVAPPTGVRDEEMPSKSPDQQPVHDDTPQSGPYPSPTPASLDTQMALLTRDEVERLHVRWNEIQGMFVDEPRSAVQQADALVSEVIQNLTQLFTREHSQLEGQWNQGNDVSTEDLRMALQRYRSFFNRLIT